MRLLIILIALQQWTGAARLDYGGGIVMAEAGPGEVRPKSISILIGASTNITCTLSTENSAKIWFLEENTKTIIKESQEGYELTIFNSTTAILSISDAPAQKSKFRCNMDAMAVGVSELYVGTAPQNITDFSCKVRDYNYMNCNFKRPENNIFTTFELHYKVDSATTYNCNFAEDKNGTITCILGVSDTIPYFPARKIYNFTLIGTNIVGRIEQNFTIYNDKIAIPDLKEFNWKVIEQSDSISISCKYKKASFYRGFVYDFQIFNQTHWYTPKEYIINTECPTYVRNLNAFWNYTLKLRLRSRDALENATDLWSDAVFFNFRTKSTYPIEAPQTPLGSFYIDGVETYLRLYWEQIVQHKQNGPNFHYVIRELNELGAVVNEHLTNSTSLMLPYKKLRLLMYSVYSANDEGLSPKGNIIRVYQSRNPHLELDDAKIAKIYHNGSYILKWKKPHNYEDLSNYTVFWCLPQIEVDNQCKGPIQHKYLPKDANSFTTEPKDRSLNLAISANYPNYNKGMQWARCNGETSSELIKMEFETFVISDSSIQVKWNSGLVCASLLKGYNLTYWEKANRKGTERTLQLLTSEHAYRNYIIHGLTPYTKICLNMYMYTEMMTGPTSNNSCVQTKASAPSPPRNLKLKANTITSNSAVIEWEPPLVSNGILQNYTIYYWKHLNNPEKENTSETTFTLTSLNSYTTYNVYVTAQTVEESVPSKIIEISTKIGVPSIPLNITMFANRTIRWDEPDLPSGRLVYYAVALLRSSTPDQLAFERISIVNGRECSFSWSACENFNSSFILKVRAVSVADEAEIDKAIAPMAKNDILENLSIDKDFCQSDTSDIDIFENKKYYFASDWVNGPREYGCEMPTETISVYVIALIVTSFFGAYFCYWVRRKYYKMKNIKVILPEGLGDITNYKFGNNNTCNDLTTSGTAKKSDISRSNDCLVEFEHKSHHNFMSQFHSDSTNALSSLHSNSSHVVANDSEQAKNLHLHGDLDEHHHHHSLETTNEEISSNSSSSNLTNSNLGYERCLIKRNSSTDSNNSSASSSSSSSSSVSDDEEHQQNITQKQHEFHNNEEGPAYVGLNDNLSFNLDGKSNYTNHDNINNLSIMQNMNNGYVTHNTQLLASILNAQNQRNNAAEEFNGAVPATATAASTYPETNMTTDGYIQPQSLKQLPSVQNMPTLPLPSIRPLSAADPTDSSRELLGNHATTTTTPFESRTIHVALPPLIDAGKMSAAATTTTTNVPSNDVNLTSPSSLSITETLQNSQPYSHHTSPIISELQESVFQDLKKDQHIVPNNNIISKNPAGTTAVDATATAAGIQPATDATGVVGSGHNHSNMIFGYVTQQQLANFGTNVALANVNKELNT